MRNEVYNCDCIEYMRTLPDHYFDIAVCDPPYGSANSENISGGRFGGIFHRYFLKEEQVCRQVEQKALSESPPPENWSRLKGGRRERYYQPTASKEVLGQHDTNALRGGWAKLNLCRRNGM